MDGNRCVYLCLGGELGLNSKSLSCLIAGAVHLHWTHPPSHKLAPQYKYSVQRLGLYFWGWSL